MFFNDVTGYGAYGQPGFNNNVPYGYGYGYGYGANRQVPFGHTQQAGFGLQHGHHHPYVYGTNQVFNHPFGWTLPYHNQQPTMGGFQGTIPQNTMFGAGWNTQLGHAQPFNHACGFGNTQAFGGFNGGFNNAFNTFGSPYGWPSF